MSKIAFVTDSTMCIPKDYCERYNITVLPQILIWGEQTYEDGVDISPEAFYNQLKATKVMPTTSQVSARNMHEAFTHLVDEGFEVLGVFISSKLSGTLHSAHQARDEMGVQKDKVEIVDSLSTAMAMGFQVLSGARAAEQGASLKECKALVEKSRPYTGVYFVVDTLEFLHRGGRIGGAQRLVGTALNLKPLLALQDGKVEAIERIRTKTKALNRMIEIVGEQCEGKMPVRVATLHANAAEEARETLERVSKHTNAAETLFTEVSPVVGNHTGPGTVGIAFMAGM